MRQLFISPVYPGAPEETRPDAEQRTYDLLSRLHIPMTRVDHDPAYTMDECAAISAVLGTEICKNLVLTPRNRSAFYLLCLPADKPFSTKVFSKAVGSSRLSFASGEDMEELLGVQPGSASILSLMNDTEHRVILALDRTVAERETFGCHPCRNTSSLCLKTSDVLDVFRPYPGHRPTIVDL